MLSLLYQEILGCKFKFMPLLDLGTKIVCRAHSLLLSYLPYLNYIGYLHQSVVQVVDPEVEQVGCPKSSQVSLMCETRSQAGKQVSNQASQSLNRHLSKYPALRLRGGVDGWSGRVSSYSHR